MRLSSTIFLSGLAAQQVAAGWDIHAPSFNCPSNTNNQCSDEQKGGFDWSGLAVGSFAQYGGFSFSGFTCSNSFSRRDSITKRTFQSKCAKATVSNNQPASFSCSQSEFSVSEMQVSVAFDCDLEFHYGMADGSTCKQVASCKKEGTVVQNTQCGGAKSVNVYLGDSGKGSCEIGLHSVGFDCNSASSTVPVSTPTPYISSTPASSVPAESTSTSAVSTPGSSSTPVVYSSVPELSSTPGATSSTVESISTPGSSSTPVVYSSIPE